MEGLHKTEENLDYGQMCRAVREANVEARKEKKSVSHACSQSMQSGAADRNCMVLVGMCAVSKQLYRHCGNCGLFTQTIE